VDIKGTGEDRATEQSRYEKPTLEELVAQITPENRYPEIATGPELGKEIIVP
jgi:hypothetical protein